MPTATYVASSNLVDGQGVSRVIGEQFVCNVDSSTPPVPVEFDDRANLSAGRMALVAGGGGGPTPVPTYTPLSRKSTTGEIVRDDTREVILSPDSVVTGEQLSTPGTDANTAVNTAASNYLGSNAAPVAAATAAVDAAAAAKSYLAAPVESFENDDYARGWAARVGLSRSKRMLAGFRRSGGWLHLPSGFDVGGRNVRVTTSDQYVKGTVGKTANGVTLIGDDALGPDLRTPIATLGRWGARLFTEPTIAALWPFLVRQKTITKTIDPAGGADYATIAAAIASCNDPSPLLRYVLLVAEAEYVENRLFRDVVAADIALRGRSGDGVRIVGYNPPDATDTQIADMSTFEFNTSTKVTLENLTATVQNGRYVIHMEKDGQNVNSEYRVGKHVTLEHLGQQEAIDWRAANPGSVGAGFDRVTVRDGTLAIGAGGASGSRVLIEDVTLAGPQGLFVHDNRAFAEPMEHTLRRVRMTGAYRIILDSLGSGRVNSFVFEDSPWTANFIEHRDSPWRNVSANQRASHASDMPSTLSGSSPIGVYVGTLRGRALRIQSQSTGATSTVRISGTAATSLFGVVRKRDGGGGLKGYAWGTKDISGMSGAVADTESTALVNTLGKLAGNCATTPKTLTVTVDGGTPINIPFTTDVTGTSNADMLTYINGVLGSAATATIYHVDQGEYYDVQIDRESSLLNDSAIGIPRWSAVKYGATKRTVQIMGTGDAASLFIGVALHPIAPGARARVLHSGKLLASSDANCQLAGLTAGVAAGAPVSLSTSTAGQFTTGSAKQIGAATDADWIAFTGNR